MQYRQAALSAFQDVSNALVSREKYEGIRAEQARAVEAEQTAVRIAQKRYLQGLSSYYEVLIAEEQLYPTQLSLAQTELNRRLVIVQLYKALGGVWKLTDDQWPRAHQREWPESLARKRLVKAAPLVNKHWRVRWVTLMPCFAPAPQPLPPLRSTGWKACKPNSF